MSRREILGPLTALVEECQRWYPELSAALREDVECLASRVDARGFGVLLLDLPELGRSYDKGLSSGFFVHTWTPELKRDGSQPPLFGRLLQASFDAGKLRDDLDPGLVFFTRCVLYLYKKVAIECPKAATLKAVEDFIAIDSQLREPTLLWRSPRLGTTWENVRHLSFGDGIVEDERKYPSCLKRIVKVLDQVALLATPKFELIAWDIVPKHGPGAVADTKRGMDKYAQLQRWPGKLAEVFPEPYFTDYRGDLACHVDTPSGDLLRLWEQTTLASEPSIHESGWEADARLSAVPKTYKGPRLITVEATANQYIQQGVLRWLRKTFPAICSNSIDFKRQDLSGSMAIEASRDGRLATVDLSAASDRLSLWTVERAFRNPSILEALASCRSSDVEIPKDIDPLGRGQWVRLKKYAGMGNATTFPVQSYVYWLCCVAAVLYDRGLRATRENVKQVTGDVRVFGDDLIIPATSVPTLAVILDYLQLKVNVSKTHWQGRFRESCGTDAYDGERVTPFYLRHWQLNADSPTSLQSWVDARNNAYVLGLWALASWYEERLPKKISVKVPRTDQDLGCLRYHSFLAGTRVQSRRRFNKELHTHEVRALAVATKVERVVRGNELDLLQYFLESPGRTMSQPGQDPILWEPGYQARLQQILTAVWVRQD